MTPLKKLIITSIVSLALITGLTLVFVIFSNNVRLYRNTLAITAAKISSGEKNFAHMVAISDLMKKHAQKIARIRYIAIDSSRPLPFIETIEQIGRSTNLKVILTVDEKKKDTPSLLFRATLEGSEGNIRAMIALIQQLPYQVKIEDISFQRDISPSLGSGQIIPSTPTRLFITMRVATQ